MTGHSCSKGGGANPDWPAPTTAYAGFSFTPNGSTPVYGWFEIAFNGSGTDFTVTQWAYQDDGSGFAAGMIPEPSTALLLGLGLAGLAAGARWRRLGTRAATEPVEATPLVP